MRFRLGDRLGCFSLILSLGLGYGQPSGLPLAAYPGRVELRGFRAILPSFSNSLVLRYPPQ